MHKKPTQKQRDFMSRITKQHALDYRKVHKNVLKDLTGLLCVAQELRVVKKYTDGNAVLTTLTRDNAAGFVWKAYYHRVKRGWFYDYFKLNKISVVFEGEELINAKNPRVKLAGSFEGTKGIPSKYIKDSHESCIANILDQWEITSAY